MPSVDSCVRNVYTDLNFNDTTVSTVVRTYALGILANPVASAVQDSPYAGFRAFGVNGTRPYSFSLQGAWPAGISIDADTGIVSGTPTLAGTYAGLSVRVTDNYGVTADLATFTMLIGVPGSGAVIGLLLAITQ